MELGGWLMIGLLVGSFFFGIWYILVREDNKKDLRRRVGGSSFYGSNRVSADFSSARSAIDNKLAEVQVHMRENREAIEARIALREAQKRAEEEKRAERQAMAEAKRQEQLRIEEDRLAAERAARIAAQEEADRLEAERLALEEEARLREEEEARKKEEEERLREVEERLREEEEARKAEEEARAAEEEARKAEEEEAQRLEDERLASEARERQAAEEEARKQEEELQRQRDLAAAEEQRLAEIAAQKEAEELAARQASEQARSELMERLKREGAKTGDVQISLMWNNYNDLDLHVVPPSGERIHGGNRKSACGGELDVDANVRPDSKKPVENVVWSDEDGNEAPGGTYKVYVHHYKKHNKRNTKDPTEFKVIVNAGGEFLEYPGSLTFGDPIQLICDFEVDSPAVRNAKKKALKIALEAHERGEKVDVDELTKQILDPENENKPKTEFEEIQDEERSASEEEEQRAQELQEKQAIEETQRQREVADAQRHKEAEEVAKINRESFESKSASPQTIKELESRLKREGGNTGEVQISLFWNNFNDLDLHVMAPSGERVTSNNRRSECGGILDLDANSRPTSKKPLENVVWSKELSGKDAPGGLYKVFVHHYKKHNKRNTKDPTEYQVVIKVGDVYAEYSGELSSGDPLHSLCEFTVEEPAIRKARDELNRRIKSAAAEGEIIDEDALSLELIGTVRNELRAASRAELVGPEPTMAGLDLSASENTSDSSTVDGKDDDDEDIHSVLLN